MKTKNIITGVALAALLGTASTLPARCALAQATQTKVVKSTEGQSETEPAITPRGLPAWPPQRRCAAGDPGRGPRSVASEVQSATKTIASTAFIDRSKTLSVQKFKFVSKLSPFSIFTPAAKHVGAQPQTPAPGSDASELAKKLSNPVASLISFPLQSNFDFGMGAGSGWRYTLNAQPIIPIALSPKWNMISRTIIPIIHQGNVTGPNQSQSGLGDTVQSLFFSPNKSEPFIWAVGPVFLLPTATDAALGAQKWGVGPTALVLKQKSGWTVGFLGNHIWSVAGKANRGDVDATFVQPFVSYSTKDAWTYGLNTESTYDWNSHSWSTHQSISTFPSWLDLANSQSVLALDRSVGLRPRPAGRRAVVSAL